MNLARQPQPDLPRLTATFSDLSDLLEGRNYTVFLRHGCDPTAVPDDDLLTVLDRASSGGRAMLRDSAAASAREVLETITASIAHRGDAAYGPFPEKLESEDFRRLLDEVAATCEAISSSACRIESFRMTEDPHRYPLYWEFGFAIWHPAGGCDVVIGASSE